MLWYVSVQQATGAHLYDPPNAKTLLQCGITLGQSSDQLLSVATSSHCLAVCFSCPPAFHRHLVYMAELTVGFMVRDSFPVPASGGPFYLAEGQGSRARQHFLPQSTL